MTGFFMIAPVFLPFRLVTKDISLLVLVFFMVYFLILSVYAFNAFGGRRQDRRNNRLSNLRHVSPVFFLFFYFLFFTISATLLYFINPSLFIYYIAIQILWVTYSFPILGLKNIPLAGTALHLATQLLHFMLVYAAFAPVTGYALLLSLYFALLFAAGHLHHEVIDYEADKGAGARTAAVVWGISRMSAVSFALFAFTALYIAVMFIFGIFENAFYLIMFNTFIIQAIFYIGMRKSFVLNPQKRIQYRNIYRLLYLLACVLLIIHWYVL